MTIARPAGRKEDRLELRLDAADRHLLDHAAKASSMSTSAFVLSHATQAAQQVLADRTSFVLPDERWDSFVEMLQQPARSDPDLVAFLARRSILGDE